MELSCVACTDNWLIVIYIIDTPDTVNRLLVTASCFLYFLKALAWALHCKLQLAKLQGVNKRCSFNVKFVKST